MREGGKIKPNDALWVQNEEARPEDTACLRVWSLEECGVQGISEKSWVYR